MAQIILLDAKKRKIKAKEKAVRLLEEGFFAFTKHVEIRLQERGFDINDVKHVIRHGNVVGIRKSPYPETPMRCRFHGKAVDGDKMVCILDMNGSLVIVTVFPRKNPAPQRRT